MLEIRCIANGKVQNVSYRVYVQDAATDLSLVGWVKNLPDGTVEVVAQGSQDTLKDFVEYLHEGSLLSKVDSVSIDWHTPRVVHEEFSILH